MKGLELAKLARTEGQHFDCATWLHKAREMPKEELKREVEKELTGRETEPHEIIYFKLHKTQIPVVEEALETAALMLGTDKSRGYCLKMIHNRRSTARHCSWERRTDDQSVRLDRGCCGRADVCRRGANTALAFSNGTV